MRQSEKRLYETDLIDMEVIDPFPLVVPEAPLEHHQCENLCLQGSIKHLTSRVIRHTNTVHNLYAYTSYSIKIW